MKKPLTRRDFVFISGGAAVAAALGGLFILTRNENFDLTESLRSYLKELNKGTLEIGKLYLKQENAKYEIKNFLERFSLEEDQSASESQIRSFVRQDFAHNKVVSVDGWILSKTESVLCSLAFILSRFLGLKSCLPSRAKRSLSKFKYR